MSSPAAHAEVTLDGTLGHGGPLAGPDYAISDDLGQLRGANLFHSFGDFTINTGESATFTGPTSVENILGRVTGGSASLIDGRLSSQIPGANLYLMNPSGLMFGPNATLDISGSFHATTADYIGLADGGRFDAAEPANSVLTTAPPVAFGFLGANPASISLRESRLEVPTEKTMSFVGGDIDALRNNIAEDPNTVVAPGGRVNIASVASPGEVIPHTEALEMQGFERLGAISLEGQFGSDVVIDARGDPGGSVFIRGGRLTMQNAGITAATQGDNDHPGTGIDIDITGKMQLLTSEIASSSFGEGNAGNLQIKAGSLEVVGDPLAVSDDFPTGINADIGSRAFGEGDAGDVAITTESLILRNNAFISAPALASGAGGEIRITTGSLEILGEDGLAFVSTLSQGTGDAGSIDITSESALLRGRQGFTGVTAQVNQFGGGEAGQVRVKAGHLELLDGAQMSSTAFNGPTDAGDVVITADNIVIAGSDLRGFDSGVFTVVQGEDSTGSGGNIRIESRDLQVTGKGRISAVNRSPGPGNSGTIAVDTETLEVSGGAFLATTNLGTGKAGDIGINAQSISLAGPSPQGRSTGIFTVSGLTATGAGELHLATDSLQVLDGARINSRTVGPGAAGPLNITADSVLIAGRDSVNEARAGIDATTVAVEGFEDNATGSGGAVQLQARELVLRDAGEITTTSSSTGAGGDIELIVNRVLLANGASISAESTNTGNAGVVQITARNSFRSEDSAVTTEAAQADGGNIQLAAGELAYLLDSDITATVKGGAGDGGNVTIDPRFVVLNRSRVTANASGGAGGNILIVTDNFIVSADSAVTASSEFGVDGDVVIRSPEDTVIVGVEALPESFLDVSSLLSERCAARTEAKVGSFVVHGRGGVPPGPDAALPSYYADIEPQTDARSSSSTTDSHEAGRSAVVVQKGQRLASGAQPVNSIKPARLFFSCGD